MLLRDAVITLTQLEQALRSQVLSGGRLGTNLVELGFVELNTLSRYLARVLDTPLAIADRFEKADPGLLERFGAEMANRHCAIPLGYDSDDPNTVFVALSNPHDFPAISAIESYLGCKVSPLVAAELRLYYYLERYYGIRRRIRFLRSSQEGDAGVSSRRERRATQPFAGLGSSGVVSIAPRRQRETEGDATPVPRPAKARSFAETCDLIDQCREREGIADALMEFAIGRFECAAIFVLRGKSAIGWRAQAAGMSKDGLERLHIPLDGSSVFQIAHDSGKAFRGRAPTVGHPVEKELWARFAQERVATDLHVVPIFHDKRMVNLLYVHGFAGHPVPDTQHQELIQLAARAGQAYARLVADASPAS